jgi:hypothetical protein
MMRLTWAVLLGLCLTVPAPAWAADPLPNTWKLTVFLDGQLPQPWWLLQLQNADGKWTGSVVANNEDIVPKSTLTDLKAADGLLRFTLQADELVYHFQGKAPAADAKKVTGTLKRERTVIPVELERTTLTSLEKFELARETFAKAAGPELVDAVLVLIGQAEAKKAKAEDVRTWADKAFKAAEPFGTRWQREVAFRIADALTRQEGYPNAALDYARLADKLTDSSESLGVQKRTLDVLTKALTKANKPDEVKKVEARIKQLDPQFKPTPYAGRKSKSDRVALVELFAGAQCPPCVAADLAFDALLQTYRPSEVVFLQYHLHVPEPDPLTTADATNRIDYYGDAGDTIPAMFINGRLIPTAGSAYQAPEDYEECCGVLNLALEKPSKTELKATATRKGPKLQVTVEVNNPPQQADLYRLRLALVEEVVAYKGANGVGEHHCVVRAMLGGPAGLAIQEKNISLKVEANLDNIRANTKQYLVETSDKDKPFTDLDKLLEMKNLRVVAFLQNDQTKQVVQAVQTDVKAE